MFSLWCLTPLLIKWTILIYQSVMLPLDEEQVCESRIQHVLTETEGPLDHIEASGSEAGKQKPTWRGIWCSWTELYLTSYRVRTWWWFWGENNTSLAFQLSASKDQSTAKKYRRRHGWLQLRRDEDVHVRFICFFSFTTCDLIHSRNQKINEGKSPINYRTDINITRGPH